MRTEPEKDWLLKAVDAFGRRFIVVSPEFEILATSRSVNGAFQYDILGRKCYDVFYGRSSPCVDCAVEEAMAKDEATLRPKVDVEPEVGRIPCHYAYPIYKDKRIEAFVSLDFDLPTRQGLEEVLQRANVFLRKLLVSAVDAVIAADKQGRILIFNEMAGKILGYDAQKVVQHINIKELYPDDVAHDVMQKLRSQKFGGKGNLRSYMVNLKAANGEMIPINLNAAIVYEGEQEIATIGYFHDMREELRMREELDKTQRQLLQAEKMASIGMLAAGIAHEINNPVAIMIEEAGWIGDLLEEEEFRPSKNLEEFERALKQINTQGNRCKAITHKLLSFARRNETKIQPVQINELIEDLVGLTMPRAKNVNVALKTSLQAELPTIRILPSEMQQVLLNLINNALDAMEKKGGGTVTLSSRFEKDHILLVVADDGPGIPRASRARVFDPFFTTKPVGKGTGLGLFICYGIIKTMGGKIDVKSSANVGTTFTISIPVADKR